jgi:hypothetical protein
MGRGGFVLLLRCRSAYESSSYFIGGRQLDLAGQLRNDSSAAALEA